jgi:hypothetical protein
MSIESFKASVADNLSLPVSKMYGNNWSLSDVLANSPTAINSIDLMEAFASALAQNGLEETLEVPIFTLDNNIDELMEKIEIELNLIQSTQVSKV